MVVSIIISVTSNSKQLNKYQSIKTLTLFISSVWFSLYFGYRDFTIGYDTKAYKFNFDYNFTLQESFQPSKDILWDIFNYSIAKITDDFRLVLLITAIGYIILPIIGVYKYLKHNTIYFFLLFIISSNFFLYGANTIRNGLAASVFLFSLKYYDSYKKFIYISLSILIHPSMLAPSIFFILSRYIKSPLYPLIAWLTFLVLALLEINLISYAPIQFSRVAGYFNSSTDSSLDFASVIANLILEVIPTILIGVYTIYIKKINDKLYTRLLITFLLSNIIYLIAFKASFSVRFAYISEFLIPFLIAYPLLKYKLWRFTEIKFSVLVFIAFLAKAYKVLIL